MRVEYTMKKSLTILLISVLVVVSAMPAVSWARNEARYELIAGDVTFGNDLGTASTTQNLFHQQTLQTIDLENLDIDFPISADDLGLGPTLGSVEADGIALGAGSSANVLPFGPVNLAFPSIEQDVLQSCAATSTGFYSANTLGVPPANLGSYPVTTGPGAFLSPVLAPPSIAGPNMPFAEMTNIMPGYERQKAIIKKKSNLQDSEFAWPYMIPTASAADGSLALDVNNLSPGIVPDVPSLNGVKSVTPNDGSVIRAQQVNETTGAAGISRQEVTGVQRSVPMNYTGMNVENQGLSYPYFPFAATPEQISKMSLLDRMWRNAHLGTMGRAYEGRTAYPTWILPTEYTKSAINMADWAAVNRAALNQTLPGTQIMPRFWDLNIV
jgi:hypothetical protein